MKKKIKLLRSQEESAKDEAFSELESRGFVFNSADNEFEGRITCGIHGDFPAKVTLPDNFPHSVPKIFIERKSLKKRIPHIEKNGKLCLVPNTGILLDSSNPKRLVSESIERASVLIQDGLTEKNKEDFLTEYRAYWNGDASIKSVCSPNQGSGVITMVTLSKEGKEKTFIFDNFTSAQTWAARTDHKVEDREQAFLLNLTKAFYPPDYDKKVLQSEIFDLMKSFSLPETYLQLKSWLERNRLPAVIILSLPLNNQEKVLIGIRVEKLTGKLKDKSQKGFRPGMEPVWRELLLGNKKAVSKIAVDRIDPEFLLKRGGGNNDLLKKTVTVIGCGAIGSHLVMKLASLGVGNLKIIDPEAFRAENLHRHVLGMSDIDKNKAFGLSKLINRNYPHLNVDYREKRIEEILKSEPDFVLDSDLVLIALGDETLELFLNDSLPQNLKRLHVWVEPLSIGGHLLLTGIEAVGCFRCLFNHDPLVGIHNQAAFAEVGQTFQSSYSGCAGVFTPFSSVDADKAANEAATLTARVLLNIEKKNMLISWLGYEDDFVNAKYILSSRGKHFSTNEKRIESNFSDPRCHTCGTKI
ncbi:MAG: ThiF family adenylyltransferase [Aridibacter sp.]